MSQVTTVQFVDMARSITRMTRDLDLDTVSFRAPPRTLGVNRTIRLREDGSAIISVVLKGRTDVEVLEDMLQGVVAANPINGHRMEQAFKEAASNLSLEASY